MNTKPRLLLTILSILSLALAARAQNLVVSNTAYPAVSGTHYENNGTGNAALSISGSLGSFTGTNITLTATAASGNGSYGVNVGTQGKLNLTNSAINSNNYGANLSGTSVTVLNNVNITTQNTNAYGINLATSSTLNMTGGTIATGTTGARGISAVAGFVSLQDTVINSYGDGINLSGTSVLAPSRANITVQNGVGLNMATSSTATITGGTIATILGGNGVTLNTASVVSLQDTTINSVAQGVSLSATSVGTLNNVNITTQNTNAHGIYLATSSTVTMIGGTITTGSAGASGVYAASANYVNLQNTVIKSYGSGIYLNGTSVLAPYYARITTQNGAGLALAASSTATITGGTITTVLGGVGAQASADSHLSLRDTTINAYGTGMTLSQEATVEGTNIDVTSQTGRGISVSGSGKFYGTNVFVTTVGNSGYGLSISDSGTLFVNGGTVRTSGSMSLGLHLGNTGGNSGKTYANLTNVDIRTTGPDAPAVHLDSISNDYTKTIVLDGGSYISEQGSGIMTNILVGESGTAGITGVGIFDIIVKGGALVSGTAAVQVWGSVVNPLPLQMNIKVMESSTLLGDVNTYHDNTDVTVSLAGNSSLNGNLASHDMSSLTVNLDNSTLTGKTTVSDSTGATLDLNLYDSGTWYMVDDSTLTNLTTAKTARVNFPAPTAAGNYHTLTVRNNLGGEGGAFAMHTDIAAGKADLLTVGGTASTGAHRITLTNANAAAVTGAESPLLLVETAGGSATFTGTTTAGVYDYSVQNGAQLGDAFTLPDTNWYLYRAGLSNAGNAIIATSAMLGYDWFYSLDALYLRMGDVREENLKVEAASRRFEKRQDAASTPSGNLWLRARAYRLNADASLSGRPFNEYAYGLTAGADKAFHGNSNASTTLLGGFLDAGRIDRDFSGANNTGYTTSISAGLYATYLRQNGWHADLVLKADRYKHHFDTTTADQLPVTGDYSNNALGASLEIGRRVQRADGWWVEPTVQAAYTWLGSANYRTGPGNATLGVSVDSVRAAQYRALVRFGRRIQNSRWLPYGKFGVVKTDLTGGALHIADGAGTLFVPDCDGWRVEFGAGTSYLINPRSQVYFDYEYDRAPHYERPWALNLGYRYGW